MIFPMDLTAENNFYELQFGKMPLPHNNIYSQDNDELLKKKYFITVLFQISSKKILCIFVFSCCGYEHLYNHLRIASQPAKSKILITWPLYKKKETANFYHRLTIHQMGRYMGSKHHPRLTRTRETTGPGHTPFYMPWDVGRGTKNQVVLVRITTAATKHQDQKQLRKARALAHTSIHISAHHQRKWG